MNTLNRWILQHKNYTSIKLLEEGREEEGKKEEEEEVGGVYNSFHKLHMQPSPPAIYKICSSSQIETLYTSSNKLPSSFHSAPGKL